MTPDQMLDRAADVIDERGLAKGYFEDWEGRVCTQGAGLVACGINLADGEELARSPRDVLQRTYPMLIKGLRALRDALAVPDLVAWNNAPERTSDEVTSAMRATAATLRAQRATETQREVTSELVETQP